MSETLEQFPQKVPLGIFLLAGLSCFMFFSFYYVFPLGVLISLFSPIPLIYIYLVHGKRVGVSVIAGLTVFLVFVGSGVSGLLFLIQYGLITVILAESFRRKYKIEQTVLFGVFVSVSAGFVVFLMLFSILDVNPIEFLKNQIHINVNQNLQPYREMDPKNESIVVEYAQSVKTFLFNSLPALITVGSGVAILMNYLMFKYLWLRVRAEEIGDSRNPTHWMLPDKFIWGFIISGTFILMPGSVFNAIGLNLLILFLAVYMTQGVSILLFFLNKAMVPNLYRFLFLGLLLVTPFFPIFVMALTGLGLFDMWADFRKLRKVPIGPGGSVQQQKG